MQETMDRILVFGPMQPAKGAAGLHALESPLGARAAISELDDIDALVKTYRARILRFLTFSTNDADLAETITQDCLLKAYNARASFRGDASVNTWLTSIAVNLIRDHQRTRKFKFWGQAKATAVDVNDVASFIASEETGQEGRIIAKEQVARLATILQELSFNQRSIFLMKFSDEMELQQIAEAMKMPINTVKTHLHRALKAVRARLRQAPGAGQDSRRAAGWREALNLRLQHLAESHLSEEALEDLLIGAGSDAEGRHLAACKACSGRLAEFRTSLGVFNQASAAWSEARSNGISRELTPRALSHSAAAAWSLACMTILAVAVSLTSHLHRSPDPAGAGANEQPAVVERVLDGPQEIASDNAMLAAIDSKLSEPVHSLVVAYGSEPATRRGAKSEVRD